ncbi:MAG: N-formylglutamate deformylase [Robiginitomaculum sp.]|nr:N-formylglutamate deformylase [Robiginitomaculum sp.]
MSKSLFLLQENDGAVLLNFPHSGIYIPDEVIGQLNQLGKKMSDTDWHVPELYQFAKGQVTWLQATHSRYVVDLNRDPDGAALYQGQAGTDLCPITDFAGNEVYLPGNVPNIEQRKKQYFTSYHQQLSAQIERIKSLHGICVMVDCHSIASQVPRLFDGKLPDLNLGTFSGLSCSPALAKTASEALANSNFSFVSDGRFKGGWITRNYGRPEQDVHVLQLEISQSCYMDENRPQEYNSAKAKTLQKTLQQLLQAINVWVLHHKEIIR